MFGTDFMIHSSWFQENIWSHSTYLYRVSIWAYRILVWYNLHDAYIPIENVAAKQVQARPSGRRWMNSVYKNATGVKKSLEEFIKEKPCESCENDFQLMGVVVHLQREQAHVRIVNTNEDDV